MAVIRDENWWDAVGKDLWRWEQELNEADERKKQNAVFNTDTSNSATTASSNSGALASTCDNT
jgi:hypothetical protein